MAINDGGFWYPKGQGEHFADRGATVRDVFAAHALAGILGSREYENLTPLGLADEAYQLADMMIAQRAHDYREAGQDAPPLGHRTGPRSEEKPWRLDLDPD